MDVCVNLMGIFSLQCVHISNHHIVQFKYLKFCQLYLNKTGRGTQSAGYPDIKLKILLRKETIEKMDEIFKLHKKEI